MYHIYVNYDYENYFKNRQFTSFNRIGRQITNVNFTMKTISVNYTYLIFFPFYLCFCSFTFYPRVKLWTLKYRILFEFQMYPHCNELYRNFAYNASSLIYLLNMHAKLSKNNKYSIYYIYILIRSTEHLN